MAQNSFHKFWSIALFGSLCSQTFVDFAEAQTPPFFNYFHGENELTLSSTKAIPDIAKVGLSSFPDLRELPIDFTGKLPGNAEDSTAKAVLESYSSKSRVDLASGSCSDSLRNAEYSPFSFCSGVIYYDFYVPYDKTLAALETEAYTRGSAIPALFNSDCLSDLKRMICADVYRPCVSEAPVPPCGSVCTNIATSCPVTVFGLGLTGTDCTDGSKYDLTESNCNDLALTAGMQLVSNSKEPYIGTYCDGVTSGEIYITNLPAPYAPFLPPMVNQILIDEYLIGVGAFIPKVLKPSCSLSRRKIECGAVYMPVEENDQLAVYNNGESIFFPQYPHQSVCTDYLDHCSGAIAFVPELGMNCTEDSFPSQKKLVLSLYGADIYTEVNYMNDTTKIFVPECPYGFRPPTDLGAVDRMYFLEPSGCVMECLPATYTQDEYVEFKNLEFGLKFTAVLLHLLAALSIYLTPEKKRNVYLTVFVIVEGVYQFTMLIDLFDYYPTDGEPGSQPPCKDAVQWLELEGSCLIKALLHYFLQWCKMLILVSTVTELWLRVVPQVKKINKLYFVLPYGIVFLSLSLWLLLGGDGMSFPPGFSSIYCTVINETLAQTHYDIRQAIIYGSSGIYVWAMWKCITTTLGANKAENPFTKLWRTYRVLFYIGFMCVLSSIAMLRMELLDSERIEKSGFDWMMCLFMEFINPNQQDYLGYCGKVPDYRDELSMLEFDRCTEFLVNVACLMATLNDHACIEYFKIFGAIEKKLFKTSFIEEKFVNNKRTINAFHTSQVSRGVTSSNVVQSTVLDSSFEAVEKYKPSSDLYTIEDASTRKYVVAPSNDDESKDHNPVEDNSDGHTSHTEEV